MKKIMLWGALFTLICSQTQAEVTPQPAQTQTPGTTTAPVTNNNKVNQEPVVIQTTPATQGSPQGTPQGTTQGAPQVQPQEQLPPANTNPTQMQNPQQTQPVQQVPAVQPQAQVAPIINCEYKIPAETKTIEQSLVLTWSEKATTQSFDFDPTTVDAQMQQLKNCFTEQGWIGFSSALEKSGNLEAIKSQKLTVSSLLDGQSQVLETKDNQWKINLPLQVVYQNDKEKVTQLLSVNLTVGRKVNGDLGIVQMIATPRTQATPQQNNDSSMPNNTTSATSPASVNTGTPAAPATNSGTNQPPSTGTTPGTNAGAPH